MASGAMSYQTLAPEYSPSACLPYSQLRIPAQALTRSQSAPLALLPLGFSRFRLCSCSRSRGTSVPSSPWSFGAYQHSSMQAAAAGGGDTSASSRRRTYRENGNGNLFFVGFVWLPRGLLPSRSQLPRGQYCLHRKTCTDCAVCNANGIPSPLHAETPSLSAEHTV